jgi:hypothetical protein
MMTLERTRAFDMERLPSDLQRAIWLMYNRENVIPQLPSHKELWNKKYPNEKLARVKGMREYNVSQDQTHDVMMAIHSLTYEYEIGKDIDDDAAVRRGLFDYIRSSINIISKEEKTIAYTIIREITYNLLYGEYDE